MPTEIIQYYYPLLSRYARRIVQNKFAAADIATQVLEQCWELPSLWQQPAQLRTHLQSATRIQCHKWLLDNALQIRKQKTNDVTPNTEHIPCFHESIANMPIANKRYVDQSIAIAHKVHNRIKELGITNKQLAEKLGTTEQEVEKIFNHLHNLRTISKLETILDIELISINEPATNTLVTLRLPKGNTPKL